MTKAKTGDTVMVHYTGTLNDGTVFDSSKNSDPLEFTIGSGQVIPGFDQSIIDMEINKKKSLNIPAADAYGDRKEELVLQFPRTELPDDIDPQIGQQLQMQNENGQTFIVIVSNVEDDNVTLDANHPLAGQNLNFEIELMEIVA